MTGKTGVIKAGERKCDIDAMRERFSRRRWREIVRCVLQAAECKAYISIAMSNLPLCSVPLKDKRQQ